MAELFSGQSKLPTDAEGRYFIDRDGRQFGAILEFLRSDLLPTEDIREVGSPRGNVYHSATPMDMFVVLCRSMQRRYTTTSGHWSSIWKRPLSCLESWWDDNSSCQGCHITEKTSRSDRWTVVLFTFNSYWFQTQQASCWLSKLLDHRFIPGPDPYCQSWGRGCAPVHHHDLCAANRGRFECPRERYQQPGSR